MNDNRRARERRKKIDGLGDNSHKECRFYKNEINIAQDLWTRSWVTAVYVHSPVD